MNDPSRARREAALAQLRRVLPRVEAFEQWLQVSGELPPDFSLRASRPWPADPLLHDDGHVATRASWSQRRGEMAAALERDLVGSAPPPPGNVRAVLESRRRRPHDEVWRVRLEFGPDHRATLPCLLVVPDAARAMEADDSVGRGAPVFLANYLPYRQWAGGSVRRGLVFCWYGACDDLPEMQPTSADASRPWTKVYPEAEWGALRRRAWGASRVVDWLTTLPFVDGERIYIGGHSRSGKQAIIAAAFDERLAGVISSSSGVGGSMAFRDCDESGYGESIELLTRVFPEWMPARLRFFAGREHLLAADCHELLALIAPRPVLLSTAIYDWVESTFAIEAMWRRVRPVYELLGAADQLTVRYRPHQHARKPETRRAFDAFLWRVSQGETAASVFPFAPLHDGVDAAIAAGQAATPPTSGASVQARLRFLLGTGPTYAARPAVFGEGESAASERMHVRHWPERPRREPCTFGDDVFGQFYRAKGREPGDGPAPAVIWLPPFACSNGYTGSYRSGDVAHIRVANAGFAHVLCFDPIGTGGRQHERQGFHSRHPDWSLMGRMVLDVRHAIDALRQHAEVDGGRVYLYGFALGAMVGLISAALDERVAGVVVVGGWTPLRTDTADSPTGGLRRWSEHFGWLPRLRQYVGREAQVPVDLDDVLVAITPRPVHVITPTLDRHLDAPRVAQAVETASVNAGDRAAGKLTISMPEEFCRLTDAIQDEVIAKLRSWTEAD